MCCEDITINITHLVACICVPLIRLCPQHIFRDKDMRLPSEQELRAMISEDKGSLLEHV